MIFPAGNPAIPSGSVIGPVATEAIPIGTDTMQNLRLQMRGHGKGQPHIHAAAVTFHRRVQKLFHLGKRHNLIKLLPYLRPAHAQNHCQKAEMLKR